ncbi:MAG TPA: glycoside hydrolase family 3 C-terminal domain-containing protein [Steroidobacteraceae bacterium]|nr:glycoside hydrolase family 3 C-terminal domain-containing protein [Steroidobacteraceae bacterium]
MRAEPSAGRPGRLLPGVALALVVTCAQAQSPRGTQPWLDGSRAPDERARLAVAAMTLDEKIGLLHGYMAVSLPQFAAMGLPPPRASIPSAGYVPGVPRLGIPALFETDASLGVANPMGARPGDVSTALPAGLALAASFNPELAFAAGAMIGDEAHAKGFNVLLGGGMDLTRDPRNGRNFEYLGEDPLLAGLMAGQAVRGTQSRHVISTVKHYALNANETNRTTLDARIDPAAMRESDLLAFNLALAQGHPGAVMCAYNEVNGAYACDNDWLLNQVLKRDWDYRGWVMSDWGAVHGTDSLLHGLDQESGEQLDRQVWFDAPLKMAVQDRRIALARVDDAVHRILRSMFAVGILEHPPARTAIDYAQHAALARQIAQQGIVLLKNAGSLLPLSANVHRIAVIGGYANVGVLSGGGSAQVIPSNGMPVRIPIGGTGQMAAQRIELLDPSAPLVAIRAAAPGARVEFDSGEYPAESAALAAHADIAIVFVTQHEMEGFDVPDLTLPFGQDGLVSAVAAANPHTVVVLETGNPVTMPWLAQVPAVLAAWYPGQEGGQAIADVLFGAVNPSGRLPISFPRAESQLVRPHLPNLGSEPGAPVSIDYSEGAQVGYRWYAAQGTRPLFAFGHGLSYTSFAYDGLSVRGGRTLTVSFEVHNSGARAGADVPQVYLTAAAGRPVLRLIGFQRVQLQPGESRRVTISADARLLGSFDEAQRRWIVTPGVYQVHLGRSASELLDGASARVAAASIAPAHVD